MNIIVKGGSGNGLAGAARPGRPARLFLMVPGACRAQAVQGH